jgi:hypothetical protein
LSERERLKNPNRDLQDFQVWIDQVKLLVKIYGSSGLMTGFTGFTPALVRCRLPRCVALRDLATFIHPGKRGWMSLVQKCDAPFFAFQLSAFSLEPGAIFLL